MIYDALEFPLFVVHTDNVELIEIFRGIMPFLAIVILAMVIVYNFEGVVLWLPEIFLGPEIG